MDTRTDLEQLTAALHLGSPALPIGSYSYSQGLESAIDNAIVRNESDAEQWIFHGLREIIGPGDAVALAWQYRYWTAKSFDEIRLLNTWFLATRETAELRQETEQIGWALTRIAISQSWGDELNRQVLADLAAVAFPTGFAFASVANYLSIGATLVTFCFSWIENQVNAALKAIPLGQQRGQQLIQRIRPEIPKVVEKALRAGREDIVTFAPMLAILSSRHETQPFRMFRS